MAKAGSNKKVDPDLKKAIKKLLKDVMSDKAEGHAPTVKDKLMVIDRALKLAAIEAKFDDEGYGTGFKDTQGDDE